MITVRDWLNYKKKEKDFTISPFSSIEDAVVKMERQKLGALVVVQGEKILGIFSERDYLKKITSDGCPTIYSQVWQFMVNQMLYVTPDYLLEECLAIMIKKEIRHLPVIEKGKLLAMLSLQDVATQLLDGKQFLINELTKYISGSTIDWSTSTLTQGHTSGVLKELVWKMESLNTSRQELPFNYNGVA